MCEGKEKLTDYKTKTHKRKLFTPCNAILIKQFEFLFNKT